MIESICICSKKPVLFKPNIIYKNETVFKNFEGFVIARCERCGVLKTFSPKKSGFDPRQSRKNMYESRRLYFIDLFLPIIRKIKQYKPSGRILDVGCSSGLLLELLKKEKYDVFGIEPNMNAYKIANKKFGKQVFYGTLARYCKTHKNKFDIIIYNHVLEHIENINDELLLTKEILKKKGILVIGLPNTANIVYILRRKYWEPLMPKEHIWHFSAKRITKLLRHYKFDICNISFSDDNRQNYSFLKRLYFRMLSLVNRLLHTGEAMLIISQLK